MTTLQPAQMVFLFLCGHAIGDFALQSEWVSTNKDRNARKKYSAAELREMQVIWPYLLSAHALHHGLIVYLISQNLALGLAETAVHWLSDFAKCEKWYGFHADQAVHVVSKLAWTAIVMA